MAAIETHAMLQAEIGSDVEAQRRAPAARLRLAAGGVGAVLLGLLLVAVLGFAGGKAAIAAPNLQDAVAEFRGRGRGSRGGGGDPDPALTKFPCGFNRQDKELANKILSRLGYMVKFLQMNSLLPDDFLELVPLLVTAPFTTPAENDAQTKYTNKAAAISARLAAEPVSGLRLLLAAADGTVVFDSTKSAADNTLVKLKAKTINENHNTRPEIMFAELFAEDGFAKRLSTSTGTSQVYVARLLGKAGEGLGVVRLSLVA